MPRLSTEQRVNRWHTAVHEAGHVLAAVKVGFSLISARIDKKDFSDGTTVYFYDNDSWGTALLRIIMIFAGHLAAKQLDPRNIFDGENYRDEEILKKICKRHHILPEEQLAMQKIAKALVKRNLSTIKKLAIKLNKKGKLKDKKIRRLCKSPF
jgi:hypothetical protein